LASAGARFESGQLALSEGRWDDARASFEAALAVDETPEAHEGVAWAAVWKLAVLGRAALAPAHRCTGSLGRGRDDVGHAEDGRRGTQVAG
jgi:uncharacterized protein HemY